MFSQGMFDNYDIPEYKYKTFQINGNDLFNMRSSKEYSATSINLGADYMFMYQSPGYNKSCGLIGGDMSIPYDTNPYFK